MKLRACKLLKPWSRRRESNPQPTAWNVNVFHHARFKFMSETQNLVLSPDEPPPSKVENMIVLTRSFVLARVSLI